MLATSKIAKKIGNLTKEFIDPLPKYSRSEIVYDPPLEPPCTYMVLTVRDLIVASCKIDLAEEEERLAISIKRIRLVFSP